MAYVGNQPARGQWRKLSDISSGFDGVITTFTTSVPPGTSEYFVTAGSASQLLISLGGVIQQPEVDYTVSTNSITFTTPPTGGLSFFGVLCGDALNVGAPADGSVTSAKLAGGLSVGLAGGSASNPSLFFTGDNNTGVFSPGADQVAISTNGNNGFQVEAINATGGVYDNVSFSVAGQETNPRDVQFSTDGSKMFILGADGDDVTEYTLSTPWDISSASYVTEFSVVSQDNAPQGMFFRDDGTKLFIAGDQNDTVYQYTLATPWSIATASYDSVSFSVASQDTSPQGVTFKPDGLTMYIAGNQNDSIHQYTLGTAWNVSTATFLQTFSVAAQETTPTEVVFSADGTTMYVLGNTGDDITVYTLTTPWDISTAVYITEFSVAAQETGASGLFIKPDGTKAYVVGNTSDAVYQYTLLPTKVTVNGNANVALDLSVGQNLRVGNGKLLVGTTTATANGGVLELSGGITFPATAVAASNANTLDDYEEGTWTPGYAFATSGSATIQTSGSVATSGSYIKIGSLVFVRFQISTASVSSPVGAVTITGFPFAHAVITGVATHFIFALRFATNMGTIVGNFSSGSSSMGLYKNWNTTTAVADAMLGSDFNNPGAAGDHLIYGELCYYTS